MSEIQRQREAAERARMQRVHELRVGRRPGGHRPTVSPRLLAWLVVLALVAGAAAWFASLGGSGSSSGSGPTQSELVHAADCQHGLVHDAQCTHEKDIEAKQSEVTGEVEAIRERE